MVDGRAAHNVTAIKTKECPHSYSSPDEGTPRPSMRFENVDHPTQGREYFYDTLITNLTCLFCKKARLGVSTLKIVQYTNDCKIEAVTQGKPLRHSAPQRTPH